MPPQDLLQALQRRPFVPFRFHVSDGAHYDVYHPELLMVGTGSAIVGISAGDQLLYDRYEVVSLGHITRIEPIAATKTKGNGQS